jgi:hypothetical protein
MVMKNIDKIIFGTATILTLLTGCKFKNKEYLPEEESFKPLPTSTPTDYFIQIPEDERFNCNVIRTALSRDFDNDGDYDLIITGMRRTYFYENDGKGNFKLRPKEYE